MSPARPWECRRLGRLIGTAATRQRAQNFVDRPFLSGNAEVEHLGTGELWERRAGSWFKIREGKPKAPWRAEPNR